MIKSMTGFARAVYHLPLGEEAKNIQVSVEIKAVNHRFCEITVKAPKKLLIFEERIKKLITEKIKRGRIDVFINLDTELLTKQKVNVDLSLAQAYLEAAQRLKAQLNLSGEVTVEELINMEGIITLVEEESDLEPIWKWLEPPVRDAVEQLDEMRQEEGKAIAQDLHDHLARLKKDIAGIQTLAPEVTKEYRKRLESRIRELLSPQVELDEQRLLTEVALFADKTDIHEELIRLSSHCQQFIHTMEQGTQVGRKLDFIIQEMNREINTIGSKANHLQISQLVVELKSNLEKLKEQVQNIE